MAVIFLNGTTSAGKTSLAKALQAELDRPYLLTGIDVAFAMLPDRFHNHQDGFRFDRTRSGRVRLFIGDLGLATLKAHHRAVAGMAASGVDLICDEVILTDELRRDWIAVLDGIDVTFVGVQCELNELRQREHARGDRVIGQAEGQFDVVHRNMTYDVEVDTTNCTPSEAARFIAAKLARLKSPPGSLTPPPGSSEA